MTDKNEHANPPVDPLLTPDETSALLGIPVKTLAHWRTQRTGPLALRLGSHVRYRVSDLKAWLEERADEARTRRAG
jgi:predicted DNA-binding transcriptional regulator AlpA